MEKIVLKVDKREKKESVKNLRMGKIVPGIVYGRNKIAISLRMDASSLLKAYRKAGTNHVVNLDLDGEKTEVLFYEVQEHPVSGDIMHVDFYAITRGEKVNTYIPLVFVGVSRAKKEEGAIIEEFIKEIEVRCLPIDLVDSFEVNLGKMETTGDNIKISDLDISSKFEIISSLDDVIAVASKAKAEKEMTEEDAVGETESSDKGEKIAE